MILSSVFRRRSSNRRILGTGIAALLLAGGCHAGAAPLVIDSFDTNQSALTLTYPPAGTTAASSVSGAGILGGERDVSINLTSGVIAGNTMSSVVSSGFYSYSQDATIAGSSTIQWDGVDGSPTLNPTGLGGVDLTGGGLSNGMVLSVFFDDLPVNVTLTVYTNGGNASWMTVALPGLLFSSTNFTLRYSSFTTLLGTGADFSNVGAITLTIGSNVTAPDVVLDSLIVAPPALPATHWLGNTDGTWTGINWASDAAGTSTSAVPGASTDVIFSATGAGNQNTTLGADFTIHSLTIQDLTPVSIGGANTLTIAGNAGTGINVQAGAGLFTMSANLTLGGASDTISVNNAAGAVITGVLGGSNGLIKTGAGTLTLGNSGNNYTGSTTVAQGQLITTATGALPSTTDLILGTAHSALTGSIDLFGNDQTVDGLSLATGNTGGTGNFITSTNGPATLTVSSSTTDSTFGGTITGPLSLTANGFFTLTLTGTNDYTGDTTMTGSGNIEVTGAVTKTNNVTVGVTDSDNELDIVEGGRMTSGTAVIGSGHHANDNFAVVDGAGSSWKINGDLTLGDNGKTNEFQISDGGFVSVTGNTVIGNGASANNNLFLIDGPGSTLNAQSVTIGNGGVNNGLILSDGGLLTATSITVAAMAGSNGILEIGLGGAPGTVNTPTVNGGAGTAVLIFAQDAASYVFSPQITGNFELWHYGPGETVLPTANTYTGDTMIFGGTLRTKNATALGTSAVSIQGGILAATGTLKINSLDWGIGNVQLAPAAGDIVHVVTTFNNDVAGGGGAFLLDTTGLAATTYTLATFGTTNFTLGDFSALALNPNVHLQGHFLLNANNVQFAITGATASGPILQNSAPVSIPTFADFTVSGPVTTGGLGENNTVNSLTFTSGSSLLIHNTLSITRGSVTLVGGSSITLDGSLAANLQMLAGSLLNGNGNILGNLYNAGLVSPGHSPGQIHVTGNYSQAPSGFLQIQIGGRDLTQHDLLSVGGVAQLGGTLQLVPLNNFKLKRDQSVIFLTAGGGVDGRFASVLNDLPNDTILEPTVIYHTDSVAVEAVQGSFEKYAEGASLTPNQRSVARALDSAVSDRHANSLIDYLDRRQLSQLPGDFDKISPDQLTSIFALGVSLAQAQSQNLQRRTDDIRTGSTGFNAAGLALNGDNPSYSGTFGAAGPTGPIDPLSATSDDGKDVKETKEVIPVDEHWGAFLSGTGEWVSVGSTANARGYDLTSGGFTLGVDYKLTPNFALGLMAGYTGSSADLTDHGRIYVNGGKIGLYATTFLDGWYADIAATGGYNSYDTRRSGLQGEARGNTDGGEINGLFGTGYDFKKGALTFGPTATFNYTNIATNGYTEHGSLAPLNIHGGTGESLRTALGFKASYDWKCGGILIKPEIRAAWQHEYGDAAYEINSSFANGTGNSFLVNGPQLGRDSALLGAGFAIQFNERLSTYFYYDGELGRKNYESNNVTGGLRVTF